MAEFEIPDRFDEITASWLDSALREGGELDVDVRRAEVNPLDPSKGLIGDLAQIRATYSRGNGPESFIVKLPAANPGSRSIGTMLQAYTREVAFYRSVAPRSAGTQLPICYYAGADDDAQRWVVVLEECHGDHFDFLAGASQQQANAAVDALADFHARWWESDERFDWMPGLDTTGLGRLQPLWLENLPRFVERYSRLLPGDTAEWVLRFAPHLQDWSERAGQEPLTMVHSDYRIDNLMFDGDRVTIIDWQTTMRAPAAMDLSCFIATSLSIDNRRHDESALIDRYLLRLGGHDIVVDRDWFLQSYDENLLWWMGQFGNNLAYLEPGDDRVQAALDSMISKVYTAGLDHDVARLL